jgi:murein DD-endopeptidase MepM/ murein hydrolase activator NlpD
MMPIVFCLLILLAPTTLSAQALRVEGAMAARSGDVVVLTVAAPTGTTALAITVFDTQWPALRLDAATWRGAIGLDLDRAPGEYPLHVVASVDSGRVTHEATLNVTARAFRRRVLRVAPDYVNPPPEVLSRITSEAAFLDAVYAGPGSEVFWRDGFVRPVPGQANSSFGTRSVFNGEERSPHAGTDFLSGPGTPIRAPAGGRIVAARDLFFSGNTVVIDHGLGLFSMLAHMSRMDVREGQTVARGDVVGRVGATGRVTGPHLHWALRLGPARVDPLSALQRLGAPR